jgi:TetR/AcrR family transcriptional repressor of nem operon
MKGNATREEIVRIGSDIIGQSGFNATGIETILKRAKVPKGSFYYYFSSKDDFGLAVIERHAKNYAETLTRLLKDESRSPIDRIRNVFEESLQDAETHQCKKGCLIGTLGQELAGQSEKFRKRIEEVFQSWQGQIAECLEEAKKSGRLPKDADSKQLAEFLLTGWEGAILRAKVMKSPRPMREFIDIVFLKVLR